jgi:hypothetical protein
MPRKRTHCARRLDHKGECRTAEALRDSRQAKTKRQRMGRTEYLEARRRWNTTSRFNRLGITEEEFNALLEKQEYACAICHQPFEGRRICADHDHNCCEQQDNRTAKTCGKCIRGLLCVKCNTWLGWMEKHEAMARKYLGQAAT